MAFFIGEKARIDEIPANSVSRFDHLLRVEQMGCRQAERAQGEQSFSLQSLLAHRSYS
jgi:HD superfamily phosphohydrolase YqeK